MHTLTHLLEDELKDLYNAENQLVKALPKLAKRASSSRLKEAFNSHLEETRGHVDRLEQAAELLGMTLRGKTCKAMQGLVEEGKDVIQEDGDDAVIDAALIGAAQRVEHYVIAAYGTARTIAERLGNRDVARLLQETLDEEGAADKKLTAISEDEILAAAPLADGEKEH